MIDYFLGAKHCAECFTRVCLFHPFNNPYWVFTDEETDWERLTNLSLVYSEWWIGAGITKHFWAREEKKKIFYKEDSAYCDPFLCRVKQPQGRLKPLRREREHRSKAWWLMEKKNP